MKPVEIYSFILGILISSSQVVHSYLEYDAWFSIELYHALDSNLPDKFTFRGNITVPSLSNRMANVLQEPLTAAERTKLNNLAKANEFYRIKAIVLYSDYSKQIFFTSSKACALTNSLLNDIFWISIDSIGNVLGITQTVAGSGNCKSSEISADDLEHFNTDVIFKYMELAPVPDTTTFVQKLEREREARERGETRDNRGFFAKYWMYIVPIVLLVLISGATNPDIASGAGR